MSGQALNRLDDACLLSPIIFTLWIQRLIISRDILTDTPKNVSLASLSPVKLMHKIHHHVISALKELMVLWKIRRKGHKSTCNRHMCLGSCGNTDRTPCRGAEEGFLEEVIPHAVLSMHENSPGGQGSNSRGKGDPRAGPRRECVSAGTKGNYRWWVLDSDPVLNYA